MKETEKPALDIRPIKNGWAVRSGEGWAVHGKTREEAMRLYHEAIERHREIDSRRLRAAEGTANAPA